MQLLSGTPVGTYRLMVSLFDLGSLRPFQFSNGEVNVEIGVVEVGLSHRGVESVEEGGVEFWVDRDVARPGDPVLMTLLWGAGSRVEQRLELMKDGVVVQAWEVGQSVTEEMVIREQVLGRFRADLEGGAYEFVLDGVVLDVLNVEEIERQLVLDGDVRRVDYLFGNGIRLVGMRDNVPQLELFWQIDGVIGESYRVFVHLVDESGAIVNQSDGEPGGWARPTTSWIPGEFVRDMHIVEGDGVVWRIGLYDGISGERLMVDGQDSVVLNRRVAEGTE